ncbi:sensor histidine kinase [Paracidovorax oryzae]|uniref:sensor histidine kinase n=1 Tax=Paracidovorax oryzae TaxID=862720 RepID=UPI0003109D4A|nr:ATP-binding protein [Paracidovorax oryzae]
MRLPFLPRALGALARRLSPWPAGTPVLIAGLAAAVGAVASALVVSIGDLRSAMTTSEGQARLLARVLEDQTTRTFDSAEMVLATLAHAQATETHGGAGRHTYAGAGESMRQALTALPFIRSVSMVDERGRVLASTDSAASGMDIDRKRLGPWQEAGGQYIGPRLPGRGLESLQRGVSPPPAPPGLAFVPLLHGFRDHEGTPMMLVALVNPDALSNFQYLALESLSYDAVIATDDGHLLASSVPLPDPGARDIASLPVFTRLLPLGEHGSYMGPGVQGPERIVAYRASRSKPLVVIVEEPEHEAFMRWLRESYPFLAMELGLVALALALTWIAWRSLRAREAARAAVDAAQDRIARSERDLALLLRSVQELIFRTDSKGVLTYVNARWSALWGEPPASAIGRRLQDLVDPEGQERVAAMLDPRSQAALRTRQLRVRSPHGDERVLDVAAVPLRAAGGQVLAFAGSAVDVTERERADQRLRAQLAFQNLLLETSPQPMMLTDLGHRVVLVNRAWEQAMGCTRERIVGERRPLYPGEEADNAALSAGGGTTLERDLPYGDGARRATRVLKAAVHGDHGDVTGVLSILVDISEFREAERATREAHDAAEEAARTRSQFVANMSHELRTPLQAIIGFAELGSARSQNERLGAMFTDILAAGQRMLALVNDLLDVAKIESDIGTIHLERTDLRGHIRTVARELGPLVASRGQDLRIDLPLHPLVARADPRRFQQVVRNVLANAIKFSPDGSCIQLRAGMDAGDTDTICIEVQDQGPGIPPTELDRIFDAFAQSSRTRNRSGGTGLGLAICRKIVEALDGRIHARNVEGGAVFRIELPVRGPADTVPGSL